MNRFYYYEKINDQKIKCRIISQTRIKNIWKKYTNKPLPEIVGVYVSDKKFEEIYQDLYDNAPKLVKNRIDRETRKEWIFKGNISMEGGFNIIDTSLKKPCCFVVIRNKQYIEPKSEVLEHELLHIIDNIS